jgi:hypothetical protein
MRLKKKLVALGLVVSMLAAGLCGCGLSSGDSDLLTEAMTAANKAKSITGKMTMDIGMKMSSGTKSQEINVTAKMNIQAINDPMKAKMDIDMSVLGMSIKGEAYSVLEGSNMVTYTKMNDKWSKKTVPAPEKQKNQLDASVFLDKAAGFKQTETKTENDKDYVVYEGKLTKEMIQESMNSMNSSGNVLNGANKSALDEAYKNVKDIPLTIWIDKKDKTLYRVTFSMTEYMKAVMEAAAKSQASSVKINTDVSKCNIDIVYTGYDNVSDFEVPAEAKSAQEDSAGGTIQQQ